MPLRILLTILATTGLYLWACHYIMTCRVVQVCYSCQDPNSMIEEFESEIASADLPSISNTSEVGPLVFRFNSEDPITDGQFKYYKESIYGRMMKGQKLEITGYYFKNEKNNTGFANLGLARANEIKKLFLDKVPNDRFVLQSLMVKEREGVKKQVFESAEFYWVDSESKSFKVGMDNSSIVTLEDQVLIYFPFNSSEKKVNSQIDQYLDDLTTRVIANRESVSLTGHTDNVGSEKSNYALGLSRANEIKQLLLQKGVPKERITVRSRGETSPIAPNNNEKNKQKNRRTVVKILP